MFGIGLFEMVLVFVVALIVLGPQKLPEVARTLGVWFYRLKKVAQETQNEIEEELRKIEEKESKEDRGKKQEDDAEKRAL